MNQPKSPFNKREKYITNSLEPMTDPLGARDLPVKTTRDQLVKMITLTNPPEYIAQT